ncbi:hypothetical protein AB9K41_02270 [Cribrihabitans sp. XS_ASV171]
MNATLDTALARLDDWPDGTAAGLSGGRRYLVAKTRFAGGRAVKLAAWEQGGGDYISLNLYHLEAGPVLRPCEMPLSKVVAFLADLRSA